MTWMIVAFDDDTLAAVLDDARVRSLDEERGFVLVTPRSDRWGNERSVDSKYLTELDDRVDALRKEGVEIEHEWVPGEDLELTDWKALAATIDALLARFAGADPRGPSL